MNVLKQSVGIDISKDTLDVTFKEQSSKGTKIKGTRKFDNNLDGFQNLVEWCEKREAGDITVYVMEATGIYHEEVLYYLNDMGKKVCVELPQRIKYYSKSKGVKTKTDKIDSGIIADYGLERELRFWTQPSENFREIRFLSREHDALLLSKNQSSNRLHAVKHSKQKPAQVIARYETQIAFYNNQLTEIEEEIKALVNQDTSLKKKLDNVVSIKGVGLMTAVKVISETDGFFLFKSISQLVSYAGLDVVDNQSGSYTGKTRISKKGNSRLRKALYMPAMTAIQYNEDLKQFNTRIMQTHHYKKQGIVAVMRKLLILIYTLWKKDVKYVPNYQWGR